MVFVGDSITDAGAWYEYFPAVTVANRGISSDTAESLPNRLDDIVRLRPRKVFLMIGVNDIASGRELTDVQADYGAILSRLESELPGTEIFVQSVLPVDAEFLVPGVNPKVMALNAWLEDEAKARGHTYLDVRALFERGDGTLDRAFSPDGLHLSGEAYTMWRDFLLPYVQTGRAPEAEKIMPAE